MIEKLDFVWLTMTIATVSILSFFLGYAIHGLIGRQGYGAYGNAAIIAGGFFAAIYGANWYGIRFTDLTMATMTGVAGAFVCLVTLTGFKLVMTRS